MCYRVYGSPACAQRHCRTIVARARSVCACRPRDEDTLFVAYHYAAVLRAHNDVLYPRSVGDGCSLIGIWRVAQCERFFSGELKFISTVCYIFVWWKFFHIFMDNGRWLSVAIVTSVWKYAREHFIESMAVWSKGLLTCEYFIANAEFLIYQLIIEKGTFYYYLFFFCNLYTETQLIHASLSFNENGSQKTR